jgi:hypothetical protein
MNAEKLKQLSEIFANISVDEKEPEKPEKKARKKREYTDEQKEKMRERMAKMREISLAKRQAKAEEKRINPPKKTAEINNDVNELKTELEELKKLLHNNNNNNVSKTTNEVNVSNVCIKETTPVVQNNKDIDLDLFFKKPVEKQNDNKPCINNVKNTYENNKPKPSIRKEKIKVEPMNKVEKVEQVIENKLEDIMFKYGRSNRFF